MISLVSPLAPLSLALSNVTLALFSIPRVLRDSGVVAHLTRDSHLNRSTEDLHHLP